MSDLSAQVHTIHALVYADVGGELIEQPTLLCCDVAHEHRFSHGHPCAVGKNIVPYFTRFVWSRLGYAALADVAGATLEDLCIHFVHGGGVAVAIVAWLLSGRCLGRANCIDAGCWGSGAVVALCLGPGAHQAEVGQYNQSGKDPAHRGLLWGGVSTRTNLQDLREKRKS